MKRYMVVLISVFLLFVISASPVMAANKGKIKDAFPPGNNGGSQGIGIIVETINGVEQGRPYFVFHTPDDNNAVELQVGDAVTFDVWHGRVATDVQLDDNPAVGEG